MAQTSYLPTNTRAGYLHASEWSEQPKLAKWEPLVESIKTAATLPDSNIIELTSKQAVQELTNIWNAYSPKGSFTLILSGSAKNTAGATHASIRAQRGRGPLKVEDIGLIALGDKQKLDQNTDQGPDTKLTAHQPAHHPRCCPSRIQRSIS